MPIEVILSQIQADRNRSGTQLTNYSKQVGDHLQSLQSKIRFFPRDNTIATETQRTIGKKKKTKMGKPI
jgi:hypothetical protein